MGTNREHMSCYPFGIARYEIKCLMATPAECAAMLILAMVRWSRSSIVSELSEERRVGPDVACGLRTHLSMQRRARLGWVVR